MRSRVYETVWRPPVCLSVCPVIKSQQPRRAAGLLLSALWTGDRTTAAAAWRETAASLQHAAAARRSAANAGG